MPALTDAACRNAACPPDRKRLRLTDAGGLYLEVAPNGSKRWFWKHYRDGKEFRLSLGSYPTASLKAAREARDAAKKLHRGGTNPVQVRRLERVTAKATGAVTFESVAREFHATKASGWSATHAAQWMRAMEKDLFPYLGTLPLTSINAPVLLATVRRVSDRGATQMARDLCQYAGQVFRHGITTERCAANPARTLVEALPKHHWRPASAPTNTKAAAVLLRAMADYKGQPATRAALMLSALTFQRPGNVRAMEWAELDLDAGLWSIPAAKMKRRLVDKTNGRPHFVPLAPQAVAILRDMAPLTGHGQYVFPSILTGERCMSENTVRAALRRMGFGADEVTAHGFRAMAQTLILENLTGIKPDVIEAQLAHGKHGVLGATYDRAEYMTQRRALMTAWADYLDRLRAGAEVIALPARAA